MVAHAARPAQRGIEFDTPRSVAEKTLCRLGRPLPPGVPLPVKCYQDQETAENQEPKALGKGWLINGGFN